MNGICISMCPENEVKMRIEEDLVHLLECSWYQSNRKIPNVRKMVKEYTRPAAGKVEPQPCNLRPAPVLNKTVDYLLGSVAIRTDLSWNEIYDFLFDRLRAVRQDMIIQEIHGPAAINIMEKITRFHVYSGYRLCDQPINLFDPKINNQHLQECLKTLLNLYRVTPFSHVNREEFEALYLVFNLSELEALRHYSELPKVLRESELIKKAYVLGVSFMLNNFVQFVKVSRSLLSSGHILHVCALHRHFAALQSQSLQVMHSAYASKTLTFPATKLQSLLWFNSFSHLQEVCSEHGIQVNDGKVAFIKGQFSPSDKTHLHKIQALDEKLNTISVSNILLSSNFIENSYDDDAEIQNDAYDMSDMWCQINNVT